MRRNIKQNPFLKTKGYQSELSTGLAYFCTNLVITRSPLIPKVRGKGATSSTTHIRAIVQECFDRAIDQLRAEQHPVEADLLMEATVHWLRHTGISDDVKIRPREHVRDDAGHGSGAITDRYIDIELKERHKSAKRKFIHKQ